MVVGALLVGFVVLLGVNVASHFVHDKNVDNIVEVKFEMTGLRHEVVVQFVEDIDELGDHWDRRESSIDLRERIEIPPTVTPVAIRLNATIFKNPASKGEVLHYMCHGSKKGGVSYYKPRIEVRYKGQVYGPLLIQPYFHEGGGCSIVIPIQKGLIVP